MSADVPRVGAAWLRLREVADAQARARDLVEPVRRHLAGPAMIHDLGTGTGAMGRWLAPQLPGPQHWIMYDRDGDLLAAATTGMVDAAVDRKPVTVETRHRDVTRLTAADLEAASLVTASALLDMLTAAEIEQVVTACVGARCPALLTMSVTGRVELNPPDPLDVEIAEAFAAHQRRTVCGRTLLGPDAADVAVEAFTRRGVDVRVRPSPWRLGPQHAELVSEWFTGWLAAACEERPDLVPATETYGQRRLGEAAAGRLGVLVEHTDLLAGCA